MSEDCAYCNLPVNPYDSSTWKEVRGWVGGPKKDSMRLREDTGRYAHDHCVGKAMAGQDPTGATLFDPETAIEMPTTLDQLPDGVVEEVLNEWYGESNA